MRKLISAFALVGFFLYVNPTWAGMTSSNYQIQWDSLTQGGSDTSSSANYGLRDSVGGTTGESSSGNYKVDAGYRAGIFDQIITFDIGVQDQNSGTGISSVVGQAAFMTNTSKFAVGDTVVYLQDDSSVNGYAVGKIASINPNVSVTTEGWTIYGAAPVVDGNNDKIYKFTYGVSANLGQLSETTVSSAVIAFQVQSELPDGYSVKLKADGGFSNGSHSITAVSDGAVTAGTEEYGARSSDSSLSDSTFDTQDTAITTDFQDVATQSGVYKMTQGYFVTLKASRAAATPSGTYGQVLTFIASGNF